MARALSQSDLSAMYAKMESYGGAFIVWDERGEPLPAEFAHAGALHGDVGRLNRIVLGGCYDDKAALYFRGLDGSESKEIVLLPGERLQSEVLWRTPDTNSASDMTSRPGKEHLQAGDHHLHGDGGEDHAHQALGDGGDAGREVVADHRRGEQRGGQQDEESQQPDGE